MQPRLLSDDDPRAAAVFRRTVPHDMRIALVNQWYRPDEGGVATYNDAMARAYVALGHTVTVIAARSDADLPARDECDGVRVYRIKRRVEPVSARRIPGIGPHLRSLRHLIYSAATGAALARLARRDGIDVVEFAEVNAEGLAAALRGNQTPAVVRCHTPHVLLRQTHPRDAAFGLGDTRLVEAAEAATVRRAAAVTAPSADLARTIEREMNLRPGRVAVIPNGIDVATFVPPQRDALPGNRPVTIVYVGRLAIEKGVFVLAEALLRLADTGAATADGATAPSWRAIFAGSDRPDEHGQSIRERLAHAFATRGLSDRIDLPGFVSQDRLVDLYHEADVCVVPSLVYESFSYTCVQAMACGRPVVASAIGGIPEVVRDGETGLLVPTGNAPALAAALERLIDDAALRARMGVASRSRAVRLYDQQSVAEQNLHLYQTVVDRAGARSRASRRLG